MAHLAKLKARLSKTLFPSMGLMDADIGLIPNK
jgi:hypothetical protein